MPLSEPFNKLCGQNLSERENFPHKIGSDSKYSLHSDLNVSFLNPNMILLSFHIF